MSETTEALRSLTKSLFPHLTIKYLTPLSGGLINTNIKVSFESNQAPIVFRLYRDGAQACRKEMALHKLIYESVPVAKILHVEPRGFENLPAFSVLEFIEGLTFQQLKRTKDTSAIHETAYSIGATLAAIRQFRFQKPGRLLVDETGETIDVGSPFLEGDDQVPRLLEAFLASPNCQQRLGNNLARRLHDFIWRWAKVIPDLNAQPSLVHNDFGNRNIMVCQKNGKWGVAAVLDWELAFSGSSLLDVGHFFRYEQDDAPFREPHFSRGFVENGGQLPDGWRDIVRVIDLTGLVECLTHDNLPLDVESELLELIENTLHCLA